MVGKVFGSAFMSSIQAKLVLFEHAVCGVCRPVSITGADGRAHGGGAMVMVERDPRARMPVPAGQSKFRRHGLMGIFLTVHDHQDVGFLVHHSSLRGVYSCFTWMDCVLIAAWRAPATVLCPSFRLSLSFLLTPQEGRAEILSKPTHSLAH